jgi:hypothetical protein
MNIYGKVLAATAFALTVALPASAEVRVGIYASTPGVYYPPVVEAPRGYVAVPDYYYGDRYYGVDPRWRERQEWRMRREAEWRRAEWLRREEWRREQWRHEQWRRERWHDHDRGWHGRD